jgi:phosphomannomutase
MRDPEHPGLTCVEFRQPALTADSLPAFRLGDVRGIYPAEINEDFAKRFAWAFAEEFNIKAGVAIGRDMRQSSTSIQNALAAGFIERGLDVLDLGLCTTELGYFASAALPGVDATIIVTASHNPDRYNGLKCVLRNGEAVTFNTGLSSVMRRMQNDQPGHTSGTGTGTVIPYNLQPDYIRYLHSQFRARILAPGEIALNGLNGTAATLAVTIADQFEIPVTWFRKEPGPIPSEGADPTNPRLVGEMRSFMDSGKFCLGVAWDGDCDRCVFFDSDGNLIPPYYVVGLLAEHFLIKYPGRAIVFDTKLCWNTLDVINEYRGIPVPSETGHAFVKQKMRAHNAIYGGELSSHHFFGDFFYCDSGMYAWLTALEIIAKHTETIGELVAKRRNKFCCTPEISFAVTNADQAFLAIEKQFGNAAIAVDNFDGPSFEMPGGWRFSLRKSKTEPLIRLNFESKRGSQMLLDKAHTVLKALEPYLMDDADLSTRLVIQ